MVKFVMRKWAYSVVYQTKFYPGEKPQTQLILQVSRQENILKHNAFVATVG